MRVTIAIGLMAVSGCQATEPAVPSHLEIRADTTTFTRLGQSTQLGALVYDQWGNEMSGVPVEWSTSTPAVIAVDPSGVATAQDVGGATIQAAVDTVVRRLPMSVDLGPTRVIVRSSSGYTEKIGSDLELVTAELENPGNPGAFQIQAVGLPADLGQTDVVFATMREENIGAEWTGSIEWEVQTDGLGSGPRVRYLRVWSRSRGGQRYEVTDTYTLQVR